MYDYHGWFRTLERVNDQEVQKSIKEINRPYPASAEYVNAELHVAFSGSPNRDLGQIKEVIEYLVGLQAKLTGCVYINDPNSERYNRFDLIKIVEDVVTEMPDQNLH